MVQRGGDGTSFGLDVVRWDCMGIAGNELNPFLAGRRGILPGTTQDPAADRERWRGRMGGNDLGRSRAVLLHEGALPRSRKNDKHLP